MGTWRVLGAPALPPHLALCICSFAFHLFITSFYNKSIISKLTGVLYFLSLYCICSNIASVVYVLAFCPQGMRDFRSPTRDGTHAPCIRRQSPKHWTTREAPSWCS